MGSVAETSLVATCPLSPEDDRGSRQEEAGPGKMCGRCCYLMLRGGVCTVNTLVMLLGALLTTAGTALLVTEHLYLQTSWDQFSMVSYSVLAAGLVSLTISFLGCCGSLVSSKCLLLTFIFSLICLIIGEITMGLLLYFQKIDYKGVTQTVIQEIVTDKYQKNNTLTVFYWDIVQSQFECCGFDGPINWAYASYNGYQDITKEIGIGSTSTALPFRIPSSCCRNSEDPLCSSTITPKLSMKIDEKVYYTEGCVNILFTLVSDHQIYFIMISALILLIELLSIIFSTCLCCTIKKIEDLKP